MAYLGPPPSQKLATPTSQYFSGNGSATAFTLNRPVNVAEDLNVFVNNVPQEPGSGKSYTATGTTLTFDAAPASGTNNVYVVYRGLAEPTTRLEHPSGQPLAATTGTFSGAVNLGTIKDAGNNATAMTIDSSGRILTPARPSFSAYRTAGSGSGTTGVIVFNNEDHDVGSCYNTSDGKFTAPIAGIYAFQVIGFYCSDASASACTPASYFSYMYKNTTDMAGVVAIHYDYFNTGAAYPAVNMSITLQLAASDTIYFGTNSSTYLYADSQRGYATFSGYLVG